ncbi:pilus assembly protein PilP [uncultured Desulfosarcina sp.]|uniref:pilus assembly protein PilP n=1 Tax=uncultured Desulfosarcina sp. TaxID=218289 RepID=UPI0029C758E1|nr:pilus assembly protein PilP [uncultured Desulfosarcina sp.]
MPMQFRKSYPVVTLILLISCFLWNCGDQKEPSQSQAPVISKKISVQTKPEALQQKDESPTAVASVKETESTDTKEEEQKVAKRIYDPTERLNPFIPLFREDKKETVADKSDKSKRKKRIPQTPLEKISLNQLKLVAIIRSSSGNKALVEENTGKGYIIKIGTYIGLNSGIVTQINANSVIVEEEIENLLGELILQNTEIKLQKPAGE